MAQFPSHPFGYADAVTEEEITDWARHPGLRLQRSAVTDPAVPGYGIYWLLDVQTGLQVWPDRWGAELEQIAEWLERSQQRTSRGYPAYGE